MRPKASRRPFWRAVKIVVGIVLMPLGIVGLFVPVLQGVLLLLLSFALLSGEIPALRGLRAKLERRYPEVFRDHDVESR